MFIIKLISNKTGEEVILPEKFKRIELLGPYMLGINERDETEDIGWITVDGAWKLRQFYNIVLGTNDLYSRLSFSEEI